MIWEDELGHWAGGTGCVVMKTHFQFNNCIKHFALLDPYNVMYVCMLFGELGAGTAFVGGLLLATSAGVIRDHINIYIYIQNATESLVLRYIYQGIGLHP